MRNHAVRYLGFLAALMLGGSFPAFSQLPPGYPTITVDKAGDGTGTVTIKRWLDDTRFAELTATPDANSVFAGWSSSCVYSFGNTCLLMVFPPVRGLLVTATFQTTPKLTITKAGNGAGTVIGYPGAIDCGARCSATYTNGTVVTLVAAAGVGQTFTGWSGGSCSGTGACMVTVATATTVTATFIDATPPNTMIISGPSNPSNDRQPTFTFSSTKPDYAFRCQLDGAPFTSCTSPFTASIGNGQHTFAVTAIDAGGNADSTPATYSWTVSDKSVELNQHGLTGSWYEPASGGQGFTVEVFPNQSPENGRAFVGWFTYDAVSGGAARQRWYTLQGPVATGERNVSLTIYQNTGGNFIAPPTTTPQPVGTATLSFDTCTTGEMTYNFTDGTGRTGTIPLARLMQNVTCSSTTPHPTNADFALSGNFYVPETSGQGVTVEVNPNSRMAFAGWYTYANAPGTGTSGQRWYTAQGAFTPGSRSIAVQISETTGGVFDSPTPVEQRTIQVGSGSLTFASCAAATFSYTFTAGTNSGLSGTINLTRLGPVPPGCIN